MQKREGPSEWDGRDGAEAMHSAVLLKLSPFLTESWAWTRTRRLWESCQHISEIATAVTQQHLVYSVTCKYSAKMQISYEILFAKFETVLHRCLRRGLWDQRPVLSKIVWIAWRIRQTRLQKLDNTTTFPVFHLQFLTKSSRKRNPPHSKYVRFLLWEWSIYTLVHIQGCAIKLNTASVARGACATVITTLSPFSLLYHSE